MNPFLSIPYYPAFDRMTPSQAQEAFAVLLPRAREAMDAIEQKRPTTWDGLVTARYEACRPLDDAWGILNHLLSVMNSDDWRKVQESVQPDIVAFSLRVGQSRIFYQGYCALREEDRRHPFLTDVQRRVLSKHIQSMEHAGVGLPPEKQSRFNQIQTELAQAATTFRNHILDATKAFSLTLHRREEIAGLPDALLAITAAQAREGSEIPADADGPWKMTLDAAVYVPFMMHSRNRLAREKMYRAYVTRASSGPFDNAPLVERILALKQELAHLLGYPTYADLSLDCKTAKTVVAVDRLIAQLTEAASGAGQREMAQLTAFAQTEQAAVSSGTAAGGSRDDVSASAELQPWDIAFWAERQREQQYDYSDEVLSRYFPYPKVLEGLFALTRRIFGITIQEAAPGAVPVWHPDVRFFHVSEEDGTPLAGFYIDPYSRPETKGGGAWMNEFRTRRQMPDGDVQRPLALLVCNQSVPTCGQPSLMRFSEVQTLFHEMGHVLQHLLTTVDDPEVSGINGIEWDAVEVASQFMENWCYDRATLKGMSRHIETGEPLPDELFDRVLAAKHFRSATALLRQLTFAATDMDLYARYPRAGWADADAVKRDCAKRFTTTPMIEEDRTLCAFSHIFGGGYAAGYYSYKWSEVLSADAFAAFEESGLDDAQAIRSTGRRFRDTLMALGGSEDPMAVFHRFRGRAPSIQPLLRHAGLLGT